MEILDKKFEYDVVVADNKHQIFVTTWKVASMYLEQNFKNYIGNKHMFGDENRVIQIDVGQKNLQEAFSTKGNKGLVNTWNELLDTNSKKKKIVFYRNPINKFISAFFEDVMFNPYTQELMKQEKLRARKLYLEYYLKDNGFSIKEVTKIFDFLCDDEHGVGSFKEHKHPFLFTPLMTRFYKAIFEYEFENYLKDSKKTKTGHNGPWLLFVYRLITEKSFGKNTIFIDIDRQNLTEELQKHNCSFAEEVIISDIDKKINGRKPIFNKFMVEIVENKFKETLEALLYDEIVMYKLINQQS